MPDTATQPVSEEKIAKLSKVLRLRLNCRAQERRLAGMRAELAEAVSELEESVKEMRDG